MGLYLFTGLWDKENLFAPHFFHKSSVDGLDHSMHPVGIFYDNTLPHPYVLTVLGCMLLLIMGILVFYSFFPDSLAQEMINLNVHRPTVLYDVNLLCSNAFTRVGGETVHTGTFVYDHNDPSGLSIQGFFYLGRPVNAYVNGVWYTGYVKKQDSMFTYGQSNVPRVWVRVPGSNDPKDYGAHFVLSRLQVWHTSHRRMVYSGHPSYGLDRTPSRADHNLYKAPVHIKCFVTDAFLERSP